MFRIMFVYGSVAGVVTIAVMSLGMFFSKSTGSEAIGYLTMLVALLLIFVGIKRYRDTELGGVIKFLPAFGLGLGITAVAGLFYVLSWELNLWLTDYAFVEDYKQTLIAGFEAKGITGEALAAKIEQVESTMASYQNPAFRMPITFLEIFPVGLVIALISAALLRNPKVFPAKV